MPSCPCCSGLEFSDCCGPIIDGAPAATPEALMRARYSAFAERRVTDFLTDTLTAEMRERFDRAEVEASANEATALGFETRAVEGGGDGDDVGTVEYVARFKIRDREQIHHELATFRREDGRWLYAEGVVGPKGSPAHVVKVGRNDPCPCGSGKKYKKCCGA